MLGAIAGIVLAVEVRFRSHNLAVMLLVFRRW